VDKFDFTPPQKGDDRAPSYGFYVERLFDAVKQVGTGNSAGLFGAGVALYYFGSKSAEISNLLKYAAFVYEVAPVVWTDFPRR
jgi:hypothetical protein